MKTLEKVPLDLVEVDFIPEAKDMEFGKFYYSREYETSNHLCACGCGHSTPLPIKEGEWNISIKDNKITVSPSILQRFDCRTHYIITNGIANIV